MSLQPSVSVTECKAEQMSATLTEGSGAKRFLPAMAQEHLGCELLETVAVCSWCHILSKNGRVPYTDANTLMTNKKQFLLRKCFAVVHATLAGFATVLEFLVVLSSNFFLALGISVNATFSLSYKRGNTHQITSIATSPTCANQKVILQILFFHKNHK